MESGRNLRRPDFLPLIMAALSSPDLGVWDSVLDDPNSPKLLMQCIMKRALRTGLQVVGNISILADMWEWYVPVSFEWTGSRHFSGVGPPSDGAVIMLQALRCQNLVFSLPPGSPGPNEGVLPFLKRLRSVA